MKNRVKLLYMVEYWVLFFFFFLLLWVACRILVSQPEFEPGPWAVNSQSANHWAARELP